MSELRAIVESAAALRAVGEGFVLGTIVKVHGSSYRRPGAHVLVTRDRWVAGCVSGGCIEDDVVRKAWWRTQQGAPTVVTYDSTGESGESGRGWGSGLGCNGVVDVLLERVPADEQGGPPGPVAFFARCLAAEERGVLVTAFRSDAPGIDLGARFALRSDGSVDPAFDHPSLRARAAGVARAALGAGKTRVVDDADLAAIVEVVLPPPHLFVIGSGRDALPLVELAKATGWSVTVRDRSGRFASRERFVAADYVRAGAIDAVDRPLAVVMSHDYDFDRAALGELLGSRAAYLGVLGPRRRTDRLLDELRREGTPGSEGKGSGAGACAALYAPAGLAIGAETPHEIALAIVAEAQAAVTGSSVTSLRSRTAPIHADVAR